MTTISRQRALAFEQLDEAALVALARQGTREAFRVLIQRCNQRLFRIARAIVRDETEAEDVLQEAYSRALAKLDCFRGEASLSTWLTRITINEARGRLRRRRPTVGLDELEDAQTQGAQVMIFPSGQVAENPEADAARAQMRRLMEDAIDDLPPGFRVVFIMREVEQLSVEETAAALELAPATVKTRLHRARRLLRESLDRKLGSPLREAFPFLGARCERITQAVLERLAPTYGWEA
jgi:RNA polymerase sigma-70 factor (ECF subfamily)